MLELAVVVLRLMQYGAASILAGSALFFVYGLPAHGPACAAARGWPRPLLAIAALALTAAALLGLVAQTAVLAGSLAEGLKPESLGAVLTGMALGKAAVARAAFACAAAGLLLAAPSGRPLWLVTGALGGLATATFAWMGHGAATEGSGRILHLLADIVHALAAAGWIGALVAFGFLVRERTQSAAALSVTHAALMRFSGLGLAFVATLALTGLVNSWFLVGLDLQAAVASEYGRVLALKLLIFAAMIGLAAAHRIRLVPRLGERLASGRLLDGSELNALRRSVALEATLGFAALATVGWLGTLAAPALS